jgi:hypothetical protein
MNGQRSGMRSLAIMGVVACGLCAGPVLAASVTGQWDFTSGLTATIGTDLQYGDGPGGVTAGGTSFGTAASFGIPGVLPIDAAGNPIGAGVDANVMRFPKMGTSAEGYKMWPGALANGSYSAGDVNQWSLVMDLYYPSASTGKYRALFQTAAANNNDADFFIGDDTVSPSPSGIGISGQYDGRIGPDAWYRIALVVNLDAGSGNPSYMKYINGVLVGSQSIFSTRFAPWSAESGNPSWILSDNDGETELGFIDQVRFYDGALSANDIAALGGITNVPEPPTLALLGLGAVALLRRRAKS